MPSHRKSPFVRRLIPTVAAVSLSFACSPPDDDNKGDVNGNPNANVNGDPNGMPNNDSNINAGTANGSTNGAPNGSTNGATNGATNANSGTNGATNGAVDPDPINNPNAGNVVVDGVLDRTDLESLCQAWSDCDPTYFQESYDSIDDCVTETLAGVDNLIDMYTTEYGEACGVAYAALGECYATALDCVNGEWDTDADALDACDATLYPAVEATCE